jgi:hypothetical protein
VFSPGKEEAVTRISLGMYKKEKCVMEQRKLE